MSGALMAKSALRAKARNASPGANQEFLDEKIATAVYFAGQVMPEIQARTAAILDTAQSGLALYRAPA